MGNVPCLSPFVTEGHAVSLGAPGWVICRTSNSTLPAGHFVTRSLAIVIVLLFEDIDRGNWDRRSEEVRKERATKEINKKNQEDRTHKINKDLMLSRWLRDWFMVINTNNSRTTSPS